MNQDQRLQSQESINLLNYKNVEKRQIGKNFNKKLTKQLFLILYE